MNVLDGRIDEPFRRQKDLHGEEIPLAEEEEVLLGHYREGHRYHASNDHHRVIEAKTAGLEVLELIMEMQVTDRIKVRDISTIMKIVGRFRDSPGSFPWHSSVACLRCKANRGEIHRKLHSVTIHKC